MKIRNLDLDCDKMESAIYEYQDAEILAEYTEVGILELYSIVNKFFPTYTSCYRAKIVYKTLAIMHNRYMTMAEYRK